MNESYSLLASSEEINTKLEAMAAQIIADHGGTSPLFVALLRGAAPFASKLMFAITQQAPDFHPELDYMMVSTYGNGQEAGEPHIVTDLAPTTNVNGRTVIVIDDVLDKGVTAQFVFQHLSARGASGTKIAVLAQKETRREYDIAPDYCAFNFSDKWLVGMGMDDANAATEGYRWLDSIWEVAH